MAKDADVTAAEMSVEVEPALKVGDVVIHEPSGRECVVRRVVQQQGTLAVALSGLGCLVPAAVCVRK